MEKAAKVMKVKNNAQHCKVMMKMALLRKLESTRLKVTKRLETVRYPAVI